MKQRNTNEKKLKKTKKKKKIREKDTNWKLWSLKQIQTPGIFFLDSSKPKKNIVFHPHLTEVL